MDGAFNQGGDDYGGRGGGSIGGRTGFRGTAENAKTKLCNRWLQGDCRFGDRCNFAHGEHELRKELDQDDGGRGGGRGGYAPRGGYGGYGAARGGGPGRGYGGRGFGAPPGSYGYGQAPYPMDQGAGFGEQRPGGPVMQEEAWAQQGFPVNGPNGWCLYRTKDTGEVYYHNHRTQVTTWERPAEWPAGGP